MPLRPMCEALGLDETPQRRKLSRQAWAVAVFRAATGKDGKHYKMGEFS